MVTNSSVKCWKLLLDLILLVLLSLMYQKKVISMAFHEIGGLCLFGLLLLHNALNWSWIKSVTVGIFRRKVKVSAHWIVDVLLLFSMTTVLITGLLIAKTLPTAMANGRWLSSWHYFFAALSLALSGVHLGLHVSLLQSELWKRLSLPRRVRTAVGALLLCVVFCFGSYSLVQTEYLFWLSQPAAGVSISQTVHQGGSEHREGELSGSGNRDGKGKGGGKGLGLGKGKGRAEAHTVSPANVVWTICSYTSILLWFSILTAALRTGLRKNKQRRTHIAS